MENSGFFYIGYNANGISDRLGMLKIGETANMGQRWATLKHKEGHDFQLLGYIVIHGAGGQKLGKAIRQEIESRCRRYLAENSKTYELQQNDHFTYKRNRKISNAKQAVDIADKILAFAGAYCDREGWAWEYGNEFFH